MQHEHDLYEMIDAVKKARELANQLKNDSGFYENASITAKNNFNVFYSEKEYKGKLEKILHPLVEKDKLDVVKNVLQQAKENCINELRKEIMSNRIGLVLDDN